MADIELRLTSTTYVVACRKNTDKLAPTKKATLKSVALLVRDVRLELTRSPTRPLNVRVCRFRQSRIAKLL